MPSIRQAWRRVRRTEPVLSVVVPVYNVADYLPECLDSLLGQSLSALEVIAVDDGSTDGSAEILRARASKDRRLRVITQANAGPGAARNRAVAEARGEFLTFCDGDDRVPATAYAYLVDSLRESGSDFVVGRARRFDSSGLVGPARVRGVHSTDRRGITAAEFPEALHDLILCNRVFRTDFWRDRVGGFPEGVFYEDHLPMVTAYVRAHAFDVLQRTIYHWRVRDDNTSTTQQRSTLQNLRDRVAARESAHAVLLAEAPAGVYETWVARGLVAAWPGFIPGALEGDDEFRALLASTYRSYLDRADEQAMAMVQHAPKVLASLCAEERWDDVAEAHAYFEGWGHHPLLVAEGGEVRAVPEPGLSFVAHVPAQLWRLADRETSLLAGFRSAHWVAPDELELTGFVAIRGLDASDRAPVIEGWLREVGSDEQVDLDVRVERDPEVNQWVRHANADYDHGRFVIGLDPAVLPARPATWALWLRVSHRGVTREGQVFDFVTGAAYVRDTGRVVGGRLVEALRDDEHGLVVRVADPSRQQAATPPGPEVEEVVLVDDRVVLRIAGAPPAGLRLTGKRGLVPLEPGADGWQLPADPPPRTGIYDLGDADADPGLLRPTEELASRLPYSLCSPTVRVTVKVRTTGVLRLDVSPPLDDQERTALGQRRLQRSHRDRVADDEVDPALTLLRAFGDDPGDEVDVPPGRCVCTVHDLTEPVPAGAEPVLQGSRAWYDALGRAGTLVSALDPPPWVRVRPGQRVVRSSTPGPR